MKPLLLASILLPTALFAADKPNIVIFMADDVGPGDISYYNKKIFKKKPMVKTPTIDALAKDGCYFTDAHSSTSLCAPTRYAMMTGNYNYRSPRQWGVWNTFGETAFKKSDATLGRVAKKAGLKTGFIGKWHLGGDFKSKKEKGIFRGGDHKASPDDVDMTELISGGPQSVGFDYSYTLPCGIQGPVYTAYENGKWSPFGEDSKIIYLDENSALFPKDVSDKGPGPGDSLWDAKKVGPILAEKAKGFIEKHASKDPFLLYFCSPMVHIPHCPPEKFNGVKVAGETATPHLDMMIDLDQQVKVIVDALKEAGEYENTLFIFTSDNGGLTYSDHAGHDASGEWSGNKNSPLEGGHRIPFIVSWPDKIKGGQISNALVVGHDSLATIASVLDVKLKKDQAKDSKSFMPLVLGDSDASGRENLVLQSGSNTELMYREGSWKLTIDTDYENTFYKPITLHDLDEDKTEADETNRVADPKYKERLDKMFSVYKDLITSDKRTISLEK